MRSTKMEKISERFKKIRKAKNLTQQDLGSILDVSKQAIANIESGHNKPSIEIISKLIENLNVNANWLIVGKDNMFFAVEDEDNFKEVLEEVNQILIKYGIKKQ